MAGSFEVRFETHVEEDGRWTIFTDAPTKLRAIEEAQNLLAGGKYNAAKVTEDRGPAKKNPGLDRRGQRAPTRWLPSRRLRMRRSARSWMISTSPRRAFF